MSSFDDVQTVWMSGEMLPWAKANIHVSAHALHYGSGAFEGAYSFSSRFENGSGTNPEELIAAAQGSHTGSGTTSGIL